MEAPISINTSLHQKTISPKPQSSKNWYGLVKIALNLLNQMFVKMFLTQTETPIVYNM
jgi:hypothetical protein